MALRISTNITAYNAHRYMTASDAKMSKAIERLSSGFRINVADDDPSGLVVSEYLRAQVSGLAQAMSNSQHAVNMIKTAEAALQELQNMLRSMRDLALHAANTGPNGTTEIAADQQQITQAIESIDRVAEQTQFGSKTLFDTALNGNIDGLVFQIGANANQTVTITVPGTTTADLHATELGDGTDFVDGIDVTADAQGAIAVLDAALDQVSTLRVYLGSIQKNSLESNLTSLSISKENLAASESAIRDADVALESVEFTRYQILLQTGTAMLAQANQVPQVVLSLLR